jgi:hypothetical protein
MVGFFPCQRMPVSGAEMHPIGKRQVERPSSIYSRHFPRKVVRVQQLGGGQARRGCLWSAIPHSSVGRGMQRRKNWEEGYPPFEAQNHEMHQGRGNQWIAMLRQRPVGGESAEKWVDGGVPGPINGTCKGGWRQRKSDPNKETTQMPLSWPMKRLNSQFFEF